MSKVEHQYRQGDLKMAAVLELKANRGFIVREGSSQKRRRVRLPNGKMVVTVDRKVFERADRRAMNTAREVLDRS